MIWRVSHLAKKPCRDQLVTWELTSPLSSLGGSFQTRSHKTETGVTNTTPPPSIILLTKTRLCTFGLKRKGSAPSEREVEWDGERLGLDARVTTARGAPHNTSPTTARVTMVFHTLDDIHIPTSHIGQSMALLSPQLGGVDN